MRYGPHLRLLRMAFGGATMVIGTAAHALPVLADGQFYGSASLFNQSGWSYTGTLPSSVSAGFRAENVDNVCIPFLGCTDGDKQYASGSRTMSSTAGP